MSDRHVWPNITCPLARRQILRLYESLRPRNIRERRIREPGYDVRANVFVGSTGILAVVRMRYYRVHVRTPVACVWPALSNKTRSIEGRNAIYTHCFVTRSVLREGKYNRGATGP